MTVYKKFALAILTLAVIGAGAAGANASGEPQRHVVGDGEIQTRMDQNIGQADADRQAIQTLLKHAEVRKIAGSAGLDLERASAAAGVLSGSALENLAAQARAINNDLVAGDSTIILSGTAIIIILLILILLLS